MTRDVASYLGISSSNANSAIARLVETKRLEVVVHDYKAANGQPARSYRLTPIGWRQAEALRKETTK